MKKLKILVKFPTRGRPQNLQNALRKCYLLAEDKKNIEFLISYDWSDATMQHLDHLTEYPNLKMIPGVSKSKIDAVNRDMDKAGEWDIVLLLSDDMICETQGWDEILRKEMKENYPDLDGVLFHNDGYAGERLNTMVICGRAYYQRFNYLYNPTYKSLWADNHFHQVANILNKQKYFSQVLFRHKHYANDPTVPKDKQYIRTESFYLEDQRTYEKYKAINFGL